MSTNSEQILQQVMALSPRDRAEIVERLLASCDQRRAVGRRDYAILKLLVRLGLRSVA